MTWHGGGGAILYHKSQVGSFSGGKLEVNIKTDDVKSATRGDGMARKRRARPQPTDHRFYYLSC